MATDPAFGCLAVVVLYGESPASSRTLQTLLHCASSALCRRLVIVDHSPQEQSAQARAYASQSPVPVVYHHDPANPPLGAAYNRAIREHLGDLPYVLILDQDTHLPVAYLDVAAAARGGPLLMAPTVRAGGRLVSPSSFVLGWGRFWKQPRSGPHPSRRCAIINSGVFIHRDVFVRLGLSYDERLRLYGIDTDFFHRFARRVPSFTILPVVLEHDLSFDAATTDRKAAKLREMLAANERVFRDDGLPSRLGVRLVGGLVRLVYALRHRSWLFLR